jgi:hypothetical protein
MKRNRRKRHSIEPTQEDTPRQREDEEEIVYVEEELQIRLNQDIARMEEEEETWLGRDTRVPPDIDQKTSDEQIVELFGLIVEVCEGWVESEYTQAKDDGMGRYVESLERALYYAVRKLRPLLEYHHPMIAMRFEQEYNQIVSVGSEEHPGDGKIRMERLSLSMMKVVPFRTCCEEWLAVIEAGLKSASEPTPEDDAATGWEVPWDETNADYMPSGEARVQLSAGKPSAAVLSKKLGTIPVHYMRKRGRGCRVHVAEYISWAKGKYLSDSARAEIADEYIADLETRKATINRRRRSPP